MGFIFPWLTETAWAAKKKQRVYGKVILVIQYVEVTKQENEAWNLMVYLHTFWNHDTGILCRISLKISVN